MEMVVLFCTTRRNIKMHIKNIYAICRKRTDRKLNLEEFLPSSKKVKKRLQEIIKVNHHYSVVLN